MDFIYSQLPEIVYDPADLTGISSNGTIDLKIDNNKRIIDASVKGTLTIIDPNSKNESGEWGKKYSYNGAQDILVNLPRADTLNIQSFQVTSENIDEIKNFVDCKIGDVGLKISAASNPDNFTYIILPIPTATASSDIQKITSINIIYQDKNSLPLNAPLGSVYSVIENGVVVLYEKLTSSYIGKTTIHAGGIYIILDTGLLAMANSNLISFTILNGALNELNSKKQDVLSFVDDNYNKDTNKAVTESTVTEMINAKGAELDSKLNTQVDVLNDEISNIREDFGPEIVNAKDKLNQHDTALGTLSGTLNDVQEATTTNQSNIKNLFEGIEGNNSKLNALDTKVDKVDDRMDDLQKDFNSLENSTIIKEIKYLGVNAENEDKLDYLLIFKSGISTTFQIDKPPKGDKGEQGLQGEKGDPGPGIKGVNKLSSDNKQTAYEIVFAGPDVKPFTFIVNDGNDGKDGTNVTISHVSTGVPTQDSSGYTITPLTFHFSSGGITASVLAKAGEKGDTGPQGPQGERGIQGIQGEVGPKGDKGETGPVGPPIQAKFIFDTKEELETAMNSISPENGDFALITNSKDETLNAELFVFSESENSFTQVIEFDNLNFPSDLIIDEEDEKLKLVSGNTIIGDGIAFPTPGAKSIKLLQEGNVITLQLMNKDQEVIGDRVEFTVGVSRWEDISDVPDYISEDNISSINNNIASLQTQIDKLQNYHPIEILSFKVVNAHNHAEEISFLEKGESLDAGSIALIWQLNKIPNKVTINGESIPYALTSTNGIYNITSEIIDSTEWELMVEDDEGGSVSQKAKINLKTPIYYGVGDIEDLNSDVIDQEVNIAPYSTIIKSLQVPQSFTANLIDSEGYIYYLGKEQVFFKVDGFNGGFAPAVRKKVIVTYGTEDYYVYRSINKLKGVIVTVEVI